MNPSPYFKEITDADFVQEVQNAEGIVVLVFYRDNCGSCKTFQPVLEEFASQYRGQVKFVRLNTNTGGTYHSRRLAAAGEPATFVMYKGNQEGSFVGAALPKYFHPIMADIFTSLANRLGIPAPMAITELSTANAATVTTP